MNLIDKNSDGIPEGDYIQMCRIMKEMYKTRNVLLVTPDVVGEDFVVTSEALNRCHKWIVATNALHDAFIEHEKDPENKVKTGIYTQLQEATRSYWREFTQTYGYEELMWFVHRGTIAQRNFRYCVSEVPRGRV